MNDLRLISDSHTVSFDCTLPGGADWVWWYLTEPEGLRAWLADAQLDPRLGGTVRLQFQSNEALVRSNCGALVRGIVSCFEPVRRLAYSWLDASGDPASSGRSADIAPAARVTFHLTAGKGRTLLSLTHMGLPASMLSTVGTGWHAHLGLLANILSEDADGRINAQHAAFVQRGSYVESFISGMRV